MRRRAAVIVALAGALGAAPALAGCSVQTAGAPKGHLTVTAMFDDSQNLVTGHSVQMSDVKIGTVTGVRLVGYRSKVTMSIEDAYRLPVGTSAEVAVTSLLGENYVRLAMPPGADMKRGPFMRTGQQITRTSVQPAFEQVVGQAGPLLKALAGDDVATVVDAGATALDGNGTKLNGMVRKSGDLLQVFADQRAELGRSVDRFAKLGRALAAGEDELAAAPGQLEKTTRLLNDNKDRMVRTVAELTRMARLLNDRVLEGRVARLKTLLDQLDPVLARLAGDRERLTGLINGLVMFEETFPRASYDGQLLLYPLLKFVLPDGSIFPRPGSTVQREGAGESSIPPELAKALPGLVRVMEPAR